MSVLARTDRLLVRALPSGIAAFLCIVPAAAQEDIPTAKRGIVGEVVFEHDPAVTLVAKPQPDLSAPMLLRLEDEGEGRYRAFFLGARAGDYDLREWIQRPDGHTAEGLPPLPARVVSSLEDRATTDLRDTADIDVDFSPRYSRIAWTAVVLWVLVPILAVARRFLRRRRVVEVAPPAPPPTALELLRPLCEAAATRPLDVEEKARLELLLYRHWRERLGFDDARASHAIERLRAHADASPLLLDLERWLHAADGRPVDPARLKPDAIDPRTEGVASAS